MTPRLLCQGAIKWKRMHRSWSHSIRSILWKPVQRWCMLWTGVDKSSRRHWAPLRHSRFEIWLSEGHIMKKLLNKFWYQTAFPWKRESRKPLKIQCVFNQLIETFFWIRKFMIMLQYLLMKIKDFVRFPKKIPWVQIVQNLVLCRIYLKWLRKC